MKMFTMINDHKKCNICKEYLPLFLFTDDASRVDGKETRCRDCNNIRQQKIDFRKKTTHLIMWGSTNYNFFESLLSTLQPGEEGDHVIPVLCGGTNTKENFQAKLGKKNRKKAMNIEYDNPKSQQVLAMIRIRCDELGILVGPDERILPPGFLNSIMNNNVYDKNPFLDRNQYLELLDASLKKADLHIDYSGKCPKYRHGYIKIKLSSNW